MPTRLEALLLELVNEKRLSHDEAFALNSISAEFVEQLDKDAPEARFFAGRIGYRAMDTLRGTLTRIL